jgi:hypothetical protein
MGAWIDASIVFGKGVISSQFLAVGPATPARPSLTGRIGRHHTSNRHDHQRARFRPLRARDRRPARCRMRVQRRQGRADSPIHAFRTLCRRLSLSGGCATSIRLGRRRARHGGMSRFLALLTGSLTGAAVGACVPIVRDGLRAERADPSKQARLRMAASKPFTVPLPDRPRGAASLCSRPVSEDSAAVSPTATNTKA